jgi:hypothetical protein
MLTPRRCSYDESSTAYERDPNSPQLQSYESTYRDRGQVHELDVFPMELPGSETVWELEGNQSHPQFHDTSMAGPLPTPLSCSPLEENHDQHDQSMPLHLSGRTTALRRRAPAFTQVTNRMHTSPYMSHQTTVDTNFPDVSPIHMSSSVTNSHLTWTSITSNDTSPEPAIASSESTCTSSTASPVISTRWGGQGHQYRPSISAQNDANNRRESSFSEITGYLATHPHNYIQHPVASLNNSHRLPTPPTVSSSQDSSSKSSTREPQRYAADFPGTYQCSRVAQPSAHPSQFSSIAAEGEFNNHYVHGLEVHIPGNQSYRYSHQQQSQNHPLQQHKHEYNERLFQHSSNLPYSFSEAPLLYDAESGHWQQPLRQAMAAIDQVHVGEQPAPPPTTMKGQKPKRGTVFHPLPCSICHKEFNGLYQNGNLKRHFKQMHSLTSGETDEMEKICRQCGKHYKRADAKRKHEWKKHRIQEARPEKRRKEKQET